MKALKKFAVPILTLAIGSATAYAQRAPTEDDINPQNRDPVSSEQSDRTRSSQQTGTVQRSQGSSVSSAAGNGMALEQLARTQPDALEGKQVTTRAGKEVGEIEKIVTRSADSMLYAVIDTDTAQAAVKLSELEIEALKYNSSATDLQEQAYDESEFEAVDLPASAGAASELVTALAMSNPAQLEGTLLTGEAGVHLGEIEDIVMSKDDNDYYAVVSDSQNRTQAVVKLDELEIGTISYLGDEAGLQQRFQESEYRDVSQN